MKPAGSHSKRAKPRLRPDGDNTRARLRETAARLFAEHGYAGTASKAICQAAGTDLAAINYHFGSRDDLYRAVLHEGHEHFVSLQFMQDLVACNLPATAKLEAFIDNMVANLHDAQNWHARIVAREVLAPSPHFAHLSQTNVWPKFRLLAQIVAEILGMDADEPDNDATLLHCVLNVVAPCLMLLVTERSTHTPFGAVLEQDSGQLAAHLKRFTLAGLHAQRTASC